jgi:hypothetical protein
MRSKEVLNKSRRRSMSRSEYVFDTKHDRYPLAVHVFLLQEERVLLMRRVGSGYADGQLGLPGVHLASGLSGLMVSASGTRLAGAA